MVNQDFTVDLEETRWKEAAGTAAYLLEADDLTARRATAATLILLSAQVGDLLDLLRLKSGELQIDQPFLLERGELFVDMPTRFSKLEAEAQARQEFELQRG